MTAEPLDATSHSVSTPLIAVVVYSGDCRATGRVALDGARLTDTFNAHEAFALIDAVVQSLDDGHAFDAPDLVVDRDELFVVGCGGPRGDPGRHLRTRSYPVAVRIGPYSVWGYLHTLPGSDPLESFWQRRGMVPLTTARIEYESATGPQRADAGTLLVNRNRTDWIGLAADEDIGILQLDLD